MSKQAAVAAPSKSAKSTKSLVSMVKTAFNRGVPLVAVTTADQFATLGEIIEAAPDRTYVSWDVIRGFVTVGATKEAIAASQAAIAKMCSDPLDVAHSMAAAAQAAMLAPPKTVLFIANAQRFVGEAEPAQALCNLRDAFKADGRSIVLLAPQLNLPSELSSDVIVLDEPLPGHDQLKKIVEKIHENSGIESNPETIYRAIEAVQGLSAFAAEQVTAMSLAKNGDGEWGLDLDSLWDRKRQQIENQPGLEVSREGIKFSDIGGLDNIKTFMGRLINGNGRPNAIVFIDEIEKMIAGQGDTSGVSQDQLGTLLSYMADNNAAGVLLVGHPGSGKSAMAKAVGNEAGIPTIKLDLGAAKGSLVGQSEQQLRDALKVVSAVSNGSTLWVATSNGIDNVPPEMRARFKTGGPFFFDLPNPTERAAIWKVHRQRFGIKASVKQPNDDGWVGREIEQCCELAWRLNESLEYAAQFVAPISQAAPEKIEALRRNADGRWLSASHPGFYHKEADAVPTSTIAHSASRKLNLE